MRKLKDDSSGMVLMTVVAITIVVLMLVPVLVQMTRNESRWTVKQQKTTTAFHLAEAALDRGVWKLKSSTETFSSASLGIPLTGYNFDKTYADVPGGQYRIRFSAGPGERRVTVLAEGRDLRTNQVRAIQKIVENKSVPGAILSVGNITLNGAFDVHWGPVMAQSSIILSNNSSTWRYPRKFSRQIVTGLTPPARDTNGLTPPNTDNLEWWSDYPVVDLPLFDFAALRSSAAVTATTDGSGQTTLNYYRKRNPAGGYFYGPAGTPDFYWTDDQNDSKRNLVWYWDGDVTFTGNQSSPARKNGLYGTLIVRGNMTVLVGDNYVVNGATLPAEAWKEYAAIDTSAANQYPGDTGFQQNATTFNLGSGGGGAAWTGGPSKDNTDIGFRGFIYVGGNFNSTTADSQADYYGAIWVNGQINGTGGSERNTLFFDGNLALPTLNVVLVSVSWEEIRPSSVNWL